MKNDANMWQVIIPSLSLEFFVFFLVGARGDR